MSSCSSEVDVIRTRISACDDENSVLYAYEPNSACANNVSGLSDTSCTEESCNEEQQKKILDVLSYCQAIHYAIQNLDKKFDVIRGKISKIHRVRVKTLWQSRKLLGYAQKNYNHLISRKLRLRKRKQKALSPSKFSYSGSYSPTIPVERPENDSQSNAMALSYHSENSLEQDQELFCQDDQDLGLNHSPSSHSTFAHSYQSHCIPDDAAQGCSSTSYYSSAGAQGTNTTFSPTQATTTVSAAILSQDKPSSVHSPETVAYLSLQEKKSLNYTSSSLCIQAGYTSAPPVGTDSYMLKRSCSSDPSTWSVEDVILFLKCVDPQILTHLADLFRQHDIDGEALLLLDSDIMMNYLGLKLGTAVKLRHYIEKLKGAKYFNR